MYITFRKCLLLLFLCLAKLLQAQETPSVVEGAIAKKIDEYLQRATAFGFSGQILIEKKGKVIIHKSYGWADRKQEKKVSNKTIFEIASITKLFTAAAILKLEMEGKLKTSDKISQHLSNVPSDKANITIHHLLVH